MPKTDEVPVFYRDQDDVCDHPAHVWPRQKCREAKKVLGNFENHGRTFRLFVPQPRIYPVTAADLKSSNFLPEATTITNSEVLANVGIAGMPEDIAAPRHLVKRAKQKIRAYLHPDVRDKQAVTAYGCWRPTELIQVTATP